MIAGAWAYDASMRRGLLSLGVLGFAVLSVRRVQAHDGGDSSSASAGFSASEHDAHLTCGPDVRVRHASAGAHVHKVFGDDGTGWVVDARGGVGSSEVTQIYAGDTAETAEKPASKRTAASGQLTFGYSWRSFGFAVGAGYFGAVDGAYEKSARVRYALLPATSFRFGRGTPFRGELGFGSPPIPALARHLSLYGDFAFKVDESLVVGLGSYSTLQTDLERRTGFYGRGGYHVTPAVQLGGFLAVESLLDGERRVGWAGGVGVTWLLDAARP